MKRKLFVITTLLFFQLVITGCKSTDEKINDFVAEYNNAAAHMSNEIITSTSAVVLPNSGMRIVFNTSMASTKENKTLYSQIGRAHV